jgi:hypothetical protein
VVYAKRSFAGPSQVLAYLARYTQRVAIANSRLLEVDNNHVSFRWKDYRENDEQDGHFACTRASCSTHRQTRTTDGSSTSKCQRK